MIQEYFELIEYQFLKKKSIPHPSPFQIVGLGESEFSELPPSPLLKTGPTPSRQGRRDYNRRERIIMIYAVSYMLSLV
jgi:hypothetical protein